ncbi:MAG: hypothetical protein RSC71_08400 [Cetobacterium sp.]
MKDKLSTLKNSAKDIILQANTLQEIDDIRVKYLGKKGEITEISKSMKSLSPEERPLFGLLVNEAREFITEVLETRLAEVKAVVKAEQLFTETLDITLPGKKVGMGGLHPITETMNYLKNIFIEMGFDVAEGPEIEYTSNNFDALNIP